MDASGFGFTVRRESMISVVVPVYNTEHYLGRCIDSILDSLCQDFELILINDGSEDRSPEICRRYCEKDRRIKMIDQEHSGVSAARNRGIEECRGEWVVFVDSDDSISKDFFDRISQEKYQYCDMLIFDYQRLKTNLRKTVNIRSNGDGREYEYRAGDMHQMAETFLNGGQLTRGGNMSLLSSWAKAYKMHVLRQYHIRFPSNLVIEEDRIFNLEYLSHIQSCVYIRKKVYYVEVRLNSSMRSFYPDFLQNDIRYQKQLKSILERQGMIDEVEEAYYNSVLSCMADVLIRGIFHPGSPRKKHENYELCKGMGRCGIYKQALKYNGKTGVIPRRILLFFFRKKCYGIVMLISRMCYKILEMTEEL